MVPWRMHFNPIFLICMAVSQMKWCNQTGMLMTQGCPTQGGWQAETQSKHSISLGCSMVFSVCFRENSLPLHTVKPVKLPGRLRGKSSFTVSQGKRNRHFLFHSIEDIKPLIPPIKHCAERKGEGNACGQSLRKAQECPNRVAGADDSKKDIFLSLGFFNTYWAKEVKCSNPSDLQSPLEVAGHSKTCFSRKTQTSQTVPCLLVRD